MDGKSEAAIKIALVDRYPRDSFQIATKCPVFVVKTAEEARNMIWTSLKRIGIEYIDYYLLHNLVEVLNGGKASDCIACGKCEQVCPQHIGIMNNLKVIGQELDK